MQFSSSFDYLSFSLLLNKRVILAPALGLQSMARSFLIKDFLELIRSIHIGYLEINRICPSKIQTDLDLSSNFSA